MAVNNSLAKTNNGVSLTYNANGEEIKLSTSMIKNYLVSGNGAVTDQEVMMFLTLCRYQHLNPFLREAYLIKYGSSPATVVVGKDVLLKRAMRSARLDGISAGVIVLTANGDMKEREGTFVLPDETLVGGWAKVCIKDYSVPFYASVSMKEYSTGKSNWQTKPATMIRKVALAQALREAFPEEMGALYDQAEMGAIKTGKGEETIADITLDSTPVAMPSESPVEATEPVQVIEPAPAPKNAAEGNVGGQTAIDDIIFPPCLDNQPPFEV